MREGYLIDLNTRCPLIKYNGHSTYSEKDNVQLVNASEINFLHFFYIST